MLISVFAIGNTSLCKFIVDLVLVQKMYSRENFSFKMLLTTCAVGLLENVKGALRNSILWLYLLVRSAKSAMHSTALYALQQHLNLTTQKRSKLNKFAYVCK